MNNIGQNKISVCGLTCALVVKIPLFLFFFLIFTPLGLVMRICDWGKFRFNVRKKISYWVKKPVKASKINYEKQY
jgi:hypothetical protein